MSDEMMSKRERKGQSGESERGGGQRDRYSLISEGKGESSFRQRKTDDDRVSRFLSSGVL